MDTDTGFNKAKAEMDTQKARSMGIACEIAA
jgi:hypothetical protein